MDVLGMLFRKLSGKRERTGDEVAAAIATALQMYLDDGVHDYESYVITIRRK